MNLRKLRKTGHLHYERGPASSRVLLSGDLAALKGSGSAFFAATAALI